ncbi:MAG: signal transduction histidine kinase, partial [Glaciecola sp.]
RLVGSDAATLVGRPFSSLLNAGSRIYHETHFAPLLRLQAEVAEVSAELVSSDGSRLPVFLHATQSDATFSPVHVGVIPAPARRRFERELQAARRSAETSAARIRLLYQVIAALSGAVTPSEVTACFERTISQVAGGRTEVWLPWDEDHLIRFSSEQLGSPETLATDLQSEIANVWRSRMALGHDGIGMAIVPILDGPEILGVLRVEALDMDMALAESLATQFSQGLLRARLYEHKDWLLGMLAHDLRTPLTMVTGYAKLLAVHGAERQSAKEQQMVQAIISGGGRMSALVDDVLEMSSVQSGMMELARAPTDLAALASRSIVEHASHAKGKGISVTLEAVGDLIVLADEARITQVFDNLISNAVKYGRLDSAVAVRLRGDEQSVRLEVQDQSEGIQDSELGRVFEAFGKVSSQTTGGERSTGLGLSITRTIVGAHGGTITVSSTTAVGSVFTVNLPRHMGKHDDKA